MLKIIESKFPNHIHTFIPEKEIGKVSRKSVEASKGLANRIFGACGQTDAWRHGHTSAISLASLRNVGENNLTEIKHAIFAHTAKHY